MNKQIQFLKSNCFPILTGQYSLWQGGPGHGAGRWDGLVVVDDADAFCFEFTLGIHEPWSYRGKVLALSKVTHIW